MSGVADLHGWKVSSDGKSIFTEYAMQNFLAAVDLIQAISREAEKMDHHPDVHLTRYRNLKIELYTHSIGGLSDKDYALAAKIDRLPKKLKN